LKRLRQLNNSFAGALQLSGFVACSGFLVHSLIDFNLHIPANALLFFSHGAISPPQKFSRLLSSNRTPGIASGVLEII